MTTLARPSLCGMMEALNVYFFFLFRAGEEGAGVGVKGSVGSDVLLGLPRRLPG